MKAAVVVEPGHLEVRDVPSPQLGDYDAVCALEYGATCSGTDLHLVEGSFPWPVHYPTILGHESVGVVQAAGAKVRSFSVGDRITRVGCPANQEEGLASNWGGFATVGIAKDWKAMRDDGLPDEEWTGFRVNQVLPPSTDPREATMIVTWRETLSYAIRMGMTKGGRLLLIGSGGNGLAFAAHARNLDVAHVCMVGNPMRKSAAAQVGVTRFVDYRDSDAADTIRAETPDGFDFIVDAVGKRGQLDRFLGLLRSQGTVGIYGIDDFHQQSVSPRRAPGTFTYYNGGYNEAETHDMVLGFMREGRLTASPWLDVEHPFCLSDIGGALAAVRERRMVKALVQLQC